jgi:hypothetical protein
MFRHEKAVTQEQIEIALYKKFNLVLSDQRNRSKVIQKRDIREIHDPIAKPPIIRAERSTSPLPTPRAPNERKGLSSGDLA